MTPTVKHLISVLEEGMRVLRKRDGLPLSDALVSERARNIATALLGSFDIAELPQLRGEPFSLAAAAKTAAASAWLTGR